MAKATNTTGLGIDHAGVTRVKEAIKAYKKELSGLKINASSSQITTAIKGAKAVAAVTKATNTCNSSIQQAINALASYENVMDRIYQAYKKEDTQLSDSMVGTVSQSLKS